MVSHIFKLISCIILSLFLLQGQAVLSQENLTLPRDDNSIPGLDLTGSRQGEDSKSKDDSFSPESKLSTSDRYESDYAYCYDNAKLSVTNEMTTSQDIMGSDFTGGKSTMYNIRNKFDQKEAKRRKTTNFNRCMNSRGYYRK
ncbi:MAG: hypothetical protein V7776_12445 [Halopseudomonas aestusnigri]